MDDDFLDKKKKKVFRENYLKSSAGLRFNEDC